MIFRWWFAIALGMACGVPVAALAQEPDLAKVREELRQLKETYEKRIEALEQRLQEGEARSVSPAAAPAFAANGRAPGENAFNPGITLILQGGVARSSEDPETYQITGFAPSGGEVAPPQRGFGLGGSELFVTGNIDPYFRGQLVASLSPENEV